MLLVSDVEYKQNHVVTLIFVFKKLVKLKKQPDSSSYCLLLLHRIRLVMFQSYYCPQNARKDQKQHPFISPFSSLLHASPTLPVFFFFILCKINEMKQNHQTPGLRGLLGPSSHRPPICGFVFFFFCKV